MPSPIKSHILIIPSWYPTKDNPIGGSFIYEQVKALAQNSDIKLGVLYPHEFILTRLRKSLKIPDCNPIEKEPIYTKRFIVPYFNYYGRNFFVRFFSAILRYCSTKIRYYQYSRYINEYVKENGAPDLIYTHSIYQQELVSYLCDIFCLEFVLTEHLSGFINGKIETNKRNKTNANILHKQAKAISCVSEVLSIALEKYFGKKPIIIPNMFDFSKANISLEKNRLFRFITVGRFVLEKRFVELVQAFAELANRRSDFEVIFIGSGPILSQIQNSIHRHNLASKIKVIGPLAHNEVVDYISKSHCLVSNSVFETFGMSILESLACGVPVLASKSGGPQELINEDNGRLFEIEISAIDLSYLLEQMMDKYNNYKPAYMRECVINKYSSKVISEQIINFLKTNIGVQLDAI